MEEKERYEWNSPYDSAVRDNKNDDIINAIERLNEQDKRIKELEKRLAENNEFFNAFACKDFNEFKDFISTFMLAPHEEQTLIRELKQQLHDLPKKIVEEIRKWGQKHYNWVGDGTGYDGQDYNECIGFNMAIDQLNKILDTILKKYGGENE